jgi:hypothetical protein
MILYDIEGELFFGAAPELDRSFDSLAPSIKTATVPGSQLHRELIPSLESVLSRKKHPQFFADRSTRLHQSACRCVGNAGDPPRLFPVPDSFGLEPLFQ